MHRIKYALSNPYKLFYRLLVPHSTVVIMASVPGLRSTVCMWPWSRVLGTVSNRRLSLAAGDVEPGL